MDRKRQLRYFNIILRTAPGRRTCEEKNEFPCTLRVLIVEKK